MIPDDFPRKDVLRYYTDPCVSPKEKLDSLRSSLKWDEAIDIPGLREFTVDAFKWEFLSGAKHFIRNLAPALLIKELRLRAEREPCDDTYIIATEEARLVKTIHSTRQHITTDNSTELRVGYVPINLVNIDLNAEDPDPEIPQDGLESEDEDMPVIGEDPSSPKKKRSPRDYDAHAIEKIWVLETWIRVGVPLKIQDYEESFRSAKRYEEMKAARKEAVGARKKKTTATTKKVDKPQGSLDQFTKITKPGVQKQKARSKSPIEELNLAGVEDDLATTAYQKTLVKQVNPRIEEFDLAGCGAAEATSTSINALPKVNKLKQGPVFRVPPELQPPSPKTSTLDTIDLSLSPHPKPIKKQRTLRRSQSDTTAMTPSDKLTEAPYQHLLHSLDSETRQTPLQTAKQDLGPIRELSPFVSTRRPRSPIRRVQSIPNPPTPSAMRPTTPSPERLSTTSPTQHPIPTKRTTPKRKRQPQATEIITLSSSPQLTPGSRQKSIKDWFSPSSERSGLPNAEPPSPSPRRQNLHVSLVHLPSPPLFRAPLALLNDANILPSTQTDVGKKVVADKAGFAPLSLQGAYADDSDDDLPPLPFIAAQTTSNNLTGQAGPDALQTGRAPQSISSSESSISDEQSTNESRSQSNDRSPSISASTVSTETSITTNAITQIPRPLQPPSTTSTTTTTTTKPEAKQRRVIRIRESLFGAFATEDVIDLASSDDCASAASTSANASSGVSAQAAASGGGGGGGSGSVEAPRLTEKKRKREGRAREWRVSQVEVLDLT